MFLRALSGMSTARPAVRADRPLRVGYLTQDFPPEVGAGPARVTEMARRWREAGADVTVITGMPNRRMPNRPDGAIHPDYRGRLFLEEVVDGIRVLRSWLFASPRRGFATTLLNNTSFMATAAVHAVRAAGPLDVLIASSPPFFCHLAGEAVRRALRAPMVLEIRDLWPDYMVEMGVLRNPAAQRALFGVERFLLRRGQHAVVVTDSFRRRVIDKGVAPECVDVISNGVDAAAYYRDVGASPPLPELARRGGEFVVGYLGNFGAGQEIRTVVEAAARLQAAAPDVRFVLAGDGTEKHLVMERAAALGVRNLSIHPPIPKDRTRDFYNACDLCLVPLAPIPIFSETVPSKIFEILACERPVLASVAGEAARIMDESGGGAVSLAEEILALRARGEAARAEMGRRGRAYVVRHYSRDALAARYLELLRRVAGGAPPARVAAAGAAAAAVR